MSVFSTARKMLQSMARRYGYQIERKYEFGEFRLDVLELLVENNKPTDNDFYFIQIGANDGVSDDPIYKMIRRYRWRGLLLEPQPDVFEQLHNNHVGNDRLVFENAALAATDGQMAFWTVPGQTSASSFNKQLLYRSGFSDAQIVETKVSTISAATLLAKHHINRVDLLQVDAEGFDFEIIKMMLETKVRPTIINYEHLLLSTADREACVRLLGGCGYKMLQAGPERTDTVGLFSPR